MKKGLWGFESTTPRPRNRKFKENKLKEIKVLGLDLDSPSHVDQNKINEKCKCCLRNLKMGSLAQISY